MDIYAFGVILLQLAMKRADTYSTYNGVTSHISKHAKDAMEDKKDVVSMHLKASGCNRKDAKLLTELGMRMTKPERLGYSRPTVREIAGHLDAMKVRKWTRSLTVGFNKVMKKFK